MKNLLNFAKKSFAVLLSATMVVQNSAQYVSTYAEETTPVVESENEVTQEDLDQNWQETIDETNQNIPEIESNELTDETVETQEEDVVPLEEVEEQISESALNEGEQDPMNLTQNVSVSLDTQNVNGMNTDFTLKIAYKGNGEKQVAKASDFIEFELDTKLNNVNLISYEPINQGDMYTVDGSVIGKYSIENEKIRITYVTDVDKNVEGYVPIYGSFIKANLPVQAQELDWHPIQEENSVKLQIPAKPVDIKDNNGKTYSFENLTTNQGISVGSVTWVDGNAKNKPFSIDYLKERVTVQGTFIPTDGSEPIENLQYSDLTFDLMEEGYYSVKIKNLPSTGTYQGHAGNFQWTSTANWNFDNVSGYMVANKSNPQKNEYYLVKTKNILFNVDVRYEKLSEYELKKIKDIIYDAPVEIMINGILQDELNKDTFKYSATINFESHSIVFSAENVPAYMLADDVSKLNGNPIQYCIDLTDALVEFGDYVKTMENVDNYANPEYDESLYEDGHFILTIDKTTNFTFVKKWADQANSDNRPTTYFTIFRYSKREGNSFENGSPVYTDGNKPLIYPIDETEDLNKISIEDLPKYDREGYEYVYYAVETMKNNNGYEIIYEGENRDKNDKGIYEGQTVTNKLTKEIEVSVEKSWEANSLQSQFSDVSTTFQLYSRTSNGEWKPVEGKTVTMDDFTHNKLSESKSLKVDLYDNDGEELEYKWQEVSVTQGTSVHEVVYDQYGVGTFTLNQKITPSGDVQQVPYRVLTEINGQTTKITNKLDDKVELYVKKTWVNTTEYPAIHLYVKYELDGQEHTSGILTVRFDVNGNAIEESGKLTIDGKKFEYSVLPNRDNGYQIYFNELQRFDELGSTLEYYVYEESLPGFDTKYNFEHDTNGNLNEEIINKRGEESQEIIIEKTWSDNQDTSYRPDVLVDVYYKNTDGTFEKLNSESITLSDKYGWIQYFGFGTEYTMENVFVVETQIGEYSSTFDLENAYVDRLDELDSSTQEIETKDRKYHVSYLKPEWNSDLHRTVFTINNKRVGEVKVDVSKAWKDGSWTSDNSMHAQLVSALDANQLGFLILRNTTDVNGTFFEIDVNNPNFHEVVNNLPKYDEKGAPYAYSIVEVVKTPDNKYISFDEWKNSLHEEDLKDYVSAMSEVKITDNDTDIQSDVYTTSVTNSLVGKKDVEFNVQWIDEYQQEKGNRFDIYLDLYKEVYKDGNVVGYEKVYEDKEWKATDEKNYSCVFPNLEKYDAYGNVIHYYAIQKTNISRESFDYITAEYKYENEDLGPETEDGDPDGNKVVSVLANTYAIIEDGTIVNQIQKPLTYTITKVWKDIPTRYNVRNLPTVTFTLWQQPYDVIDDAAKVPVATYTIEQGKWDAYSTTFLFKYLGENNPAREDSSNQDLIPIYDENGKKFKYSVTENVTLVNGTSATADEVYDPDVQVKDAVSFTNVYSPTTIEIRLGKYIDLGQYKDKQATVTFQIYQDYNGVERLYESRSINLYGAGEQIEDNIYYNYTNILLPKYAPDGTKYTYKVREQALDGYEGKYDAKYATRTTRPDYNQVDDDYVDIDKKYAVPDGKLDVENKNIVTFYNTYTTKKTHVVFTKRWIDNNNANHTRDELSFTLKRVANGDGDNKVEQSVNFSLPKDITDSEKSFMIGPFKGYSAFTLTLKSQDGKPISESNYIDFTIGVNASGEDELEASSTNGTDFTYSITENKPAQTSGTVYKQSNTTWEVNKESTKAIIENSFETNVNLTKTWKGDGNKTPVNNTGSDILVVAELYASLNNGEWNKVSGSPLQNALNAYANLMHRTIPTSVVFAYPKNMPMTNQTKAITGLPSSLVVNGQQASIRYLLVESKVSYNSGQSVNDLSNGLSFTEDNGSVTLNYAATGEDHVIYPSDNPTFTPTNGTTDSLKNVSTNQIEKTSSKVTKIWDDQTNKYHTRGNSTNNGSSLIAFRLQRKLGGNNWEDVQKISLAFNGQMNTKTEIIEDLPKSNRIDGKKVDYLYRFVELQKDGQTVVQNLYNETYATTVKQFDSAGQAQDATFTNTLKTVTIKASKAFKQNVKNKQTVKFTLKYKNTKGQLQNVVYYKDSTAYRMVVKLDGVKDNQNPSFYESEPWTATWVNVPEVYPNSQVDGNGKTIYYIQETENKYAYQVNADGEIISDVVEDKGTVTNKLTELKISKSVFDPTHSQSSLDETFTFEISGDNGKFSIVKNGKDELLEISNGKGTFTLKNNESATIYGLPVGKAYTVKEINSDAWNVYKEDKKTNGREQSVTINDVDGHSLTFHNVKKSTLTITKQADIYTGSSYEVQGLKEAKFVIKANEKLVQWIGKDIEKNNYLQLVNGQWSGVENQADATVFTSDKDGKFTVDNLPLGSIKVMETEAPNGYKVAAPIDVNTNNGTSSQGVYKVEASYTKDERYPYTVQLTKQDEDDATLFLPGAEFKLYANEAIHQQNSGKLIHSKDAVVQTVTTDANGKAEFKDIPYGSYYVKETKAPDGYKWDQNTLFYIQTNADGTITVTKPSTSMANSETKDSTASVAINNTKIQLRLLKANSNDEEVLNPSSIEGNDYAVFKVEGKFADTTNVKYVTNSKGTKYAGTETLVSMQEMDGQWIYNELYTFTEIYAPQGYREANPFTITVQSDGTITSTNVKVQDSMMTVFDAPTELILYKFDSSTNKEIDKSRKEAVFEISGQFATKGNKVKIKPSEIGQLNHEWIADVVYTMTELSAPNGYALAKPFEFKIESSGNIVLIGSVDYVSVVDNSITIEDDEITMSLTKVTGLNTVDEAEIGKVNDYAEFDITGNFADGTTTAHKNTTEMASMNSLWVSGETYTFKETYAPNGYEIADPFTITVNADGTFTSKSTFVRVDGNIVRINDEQLDVDLQKLDGTTPLSGAKVRIDGTFVDGTTSKEIEIDNNTIELNSLLIGGNSYTIEEIFAPNGYKRNSNIVEFTVSQKGIVSISEKDLNKGYSAVDNVITLNNNPITVSALKVNSIDSTESIEGKDYAVFKVEGNFVDKSTVKYVANSEKTGYTDNNVVTFASLDRQWIYGQSYTFTEVYAPQGYKLANSFSIQVLENGNVEVNPSVDFVKVINNQIVIVDDKIALDFKKVSNETLLNGAIVKVSGTFTDGSVEKEITIQNDSVELDGYIVANQEYSVTEIVAPNGYTLNHNEFKFKVDANGKLTASQTADGYRIENGQIVLEDEAIDVALKKVGEGNVELSATDLATFTLSGQFNNGDATFENVTTENMSQFNALWMQSNDKEKYVYNMTETYAPAGYMAIETFYFIVDVDGNIVLSDKEGNETNYTYVSASKNAITVSDPMTRVVIEKLDANHKALSDAILQIVDDNGVVVGNIHSNTKECEIVGKLVAGKSYTLQEVSAPQTYVKAADVRFTIPATTKDQKVETVQVRMIDQQVAVEKVDENKQALQGAKFEVYNVNGDVVDSWTTGKDKHYISNLVFNETYTFSEVYTPAGYVKAEDVTFTVNNALFEDSIKVFTIVNNDDEKTIELTKVDEKTNEIISSPATFGLYSDKDCTNLVDKGEKDTKDGKISWTVKYGLLAPEGVEDAKGEKTTYYIKEMKAPTGYALNDHVYQVEIENTTAERKVYIDSVETTEMKAMDVPTSIRFTKQDEQGNALVASFEIHEVGNDDFKTISFTTSEQIPVVEIVNKLTANHTYVLKETIAPDGYLFADDITFKVTNDNSGTILDILNEDGSIKETIDTSTVPVIVIDRLTEVVFEKYDVDDTDKKEMLEDATFEILNKDGDVIETFTTTKEATVIHQLHLDETYTLHEVKAPDGYYVIEDIEFTIVRDGSNMKVMIQNEPVENNIVNILDPQTVVYIDKVDENKKSLKGAQLKVVDEDGKVMDTWTSDGSKHEIKGKLVAGKTYKLVEVKAPTGYQVAKDVSFKVDEMKPEKDVVVTMVDKSEVPTGTGTDTTFYSVTLLGSAFILFEILSKRKRRHE